MSFYEYRLYAEAFQRRREYETEMCLLLAWKTAELSRAKKLPLLKNVLAQVKQTPKKPKTPEALYEIAKAITLRMGGEVK